MTLGFSRHSSAHTARAADNDSEADSDEEAEEMEGIVICARKCNCAVFSVFRKS